MATDAAPTDAPKLVVHHLNNSRSQRVLMLLEELGLPYEIKLYQRDPQTQLAPPELRAVHPLGKSPVVTDGDLVLAESGAIIEYIVDTYDTARALQPPASDRAACVRFRYLLHYAEGTAMPYLVMHVVLNYVDKAVPFLVRPIGRGITGAIKTNFIEPNLKANLDMLEGFLQKSTWFCGEQFTAADINLFYVVFSARELGWLADANAYPKLLAYLQRFQERPAWQRAIARGGPFK